MTPSYDRVPSDMLRKQLLCGPLRPLLSMADCKDCDPRTGYLPRGVHDAGWRDVAGRFAGNSHRARLIGGLLAACRNLAAAGCGGLLLDGSFVTAKSLPGDYDGAWETAGVDPDLLDPVLLDFSNRRAAMKAMYLGDVFPAPAIAAPGELYRASLGPTETASRRSSYWSIWRACHDCQREAVQNHAEEGGRLCPRDRGVRCEVAPTYRCASDAARAELEAMESQLVDLREELEEYEQLKSADLSVISVATFDGLVDGLIKARIASGLSQRALA